MKKKSFVVLLPCLLTLFGCNRIEITVPQGYTGGVYLIKSNVPKDELTLDSNGIGYITEDTFEDLKWQPIVHDASGKDLTANLVGYNPSAFWGVGKSESIKPKMKIEYMGFEIVPDNLKGQKQYYDRDLFKLVDTLKVK
ncbi:MAG: hypothetical protein JST26_07955 [Bacteroidetes bacterium]|nr:hypothetical protein [Bacteroidota bacterium]